MSSTTRTQRRYDHRLRELVQKTGDVELAVRHGVPRSTARAWRNRSVADVVTLDVLELDAVQLQREVMLLRRRVERLIALLRLVVIVLKTSRASLANVRFPEGTVKLRLLRAVERSRSDLPLRAVLRVIGVSQARYYDWTREERCGLDDRESCPKSSPHQLTTAEVNAIRDMVTSDAYRHVSTGVLARLAQRLGKVFASPSTWHRLMRLHKWRRPRQRVHPATPKIGVRASRANEIWHVDTTILRLLDGSKVYLHAVIDNFSRRILAWRVLDRFHPAVTAQLLLDANKAMSAQQPTVLVDGGIENYNGAVNELVDSGLLQRLLARTDIRSSNSLIESWWRVLKHQWLYLNQLDSPSTVRKLVAFYVEQHNVHLPHSAFQGQTPNEMYFGTGGHVPEQLKSGCLAARASRLKLNRAMSCQACEKTAVIAR